MLAQRELVGARVALAWLGLCLASVPSAVLGIVDSFTIVTPRATALLQTMGVVGEAALPALSIVWNTVDWALVTSGVLGLSVCGLTVVVALRCVGPTTATAMERQQLAIIEDSELAP
jgi:hypothetical protein